MKLNQNSDEDKSATHFKLPSLTIKHYFNHFNNNIQLTGINTVSGDFYDSSLRHSEVSYIGLMLDFDGFR